MHALEGEAMRHQWVDEILGLNVNRCGDPSLLMKERKQRIKLWLETGKRSSRDAGGTVGGFA